MTTGAPAPLPLWKKILFSGIALLIVLTALDLCGHVYYRVHKGVFLWNDQRALALFNVRPFTRVVRDDRVITLKKDFSDGLYAMDDNGFRTGLNVYKGKSRDIVFLGDSVPFGWGIAGDQTLPSQFFRLLTAHGDTATGVINAAIPSYTLYQAVQRYEKEIDGKYPVSAVVLQVFDPASQLALRGNEWNRRMNWVTNGKDVDAQDYLWIQNQQWLRYSSILYFAFMARYMLGHTSLQLSPRDAALQKRFMDDNEQVLAQLGNVLQKRNIALYLLPVNPAGGIDAQPAPLAAAIRWLNESMKTYAASAPRTHFLDIGKAFDAAGRQGMFVDDCCHLSGQGARLQAEAVYAGMKPGGDVP